MPYTQDDLQRLQTALARGEQRVSFQDKTVVYRSVDELQAAIREVQRSLDTQRGTARKRQIRVTTSKGF
jgi:hypothetical protein